MNPAALAGLAAQLQAPRPQMPPGVPGMPPMLGFPGMPPMGMPMGMLGMQMPGAVPAMIEAPAVGGPQGEVILDCPQDLVGRVIGRGGETIRDLQTKTGCSIQIDQKFPEGHPHKITIKGDGAKLE